MPLRVVFELMRRTSWGIVSLGLVTDDFLAKQTIDRMYEELRQDALKPEGDTLLADFPAGTAEAIRTQGWDHFSVNNRNGATPIFYAVARNLWNSVPSSIIDWRLMEADDQFSAFSEDVPHTRGIVQH